MSTVSRRSFFAADAIPFSIWFEDRALAEGPSKRFDVLSPDDQGNPLRWVFEWYAQAVKKAQGLNRVYHSQCASKSLATEMCSTCQGEPDLAAKGQEDDQVFNFDVTSTLHVMALPDMLKHTQGDHRPILQALQWRHDCSGDVSFPETD
jgi:hypothetical protein